MINTGRTAESIINPGDNPPITDLISEGEYYRMQTFDQHLFDLVRDGVVTYETAITASTAPQDLTVQLRAAGIIQ
jgi:twitching motility protein PilT